MGADLESLGDRGKTKFGGDCAAVPFHKGGADLENFITINTDYLGYLCGIATGGAVKLFALANVNLTQEGTLGHDGQGAINSGAGDGVVDCAGMDKQLLSSEMLLL